MLDVAVQAEPDWDDGADWDMLGEAAVRIAISSSRAST